MDLVNASVDVCLSSSHNDISYLIVIWPVCLALIRAIWKFFLKLQVGRSQSACVNTDSLSRITFELLVRENNFGVSVLKDLISTLCAVVIIWTLYNVRVCCNRLAGFRKLAMFYITWNRLKTITKLLLILFFIFQFFVTPSTPLFNLWKWIFLNL